MKNNLIISLQDSVDFMQAQYLSQLLINSGKKSNITLLSWEDHKQYQILESENLSYLYIERSLINKIMNNNLIPDTHAVNILSDNLNRVCGKNWESVTAFSYNQFTSTLLSIIEAKERIGCWYGQDSNLYFSSQNEMFINDVRMDNPLLVNRTEWYERSFGVENTVFDINAWISDSKIKEIKQSAEDIQNYFSKKHSSRTSLVLGLNVNSFINDQEALAELIFHIQADPETFQVLYFVDETKNEEKELIQQLETVLGIELLYCLYNPDSLIEAIANIDVLVDAKATVLSEMAYWQKKKVVSIFSDSGSFSSAGLARGELDVWINSEIDQVDGLFLVSLLKNIISQGAVGENLESSSSNLEVLSHKRDSLVEFEWRDFPRNENVKNIGEYFGRIFFKSTVEGTDFSELAGPSLTTLFSLNIDEVEIKNYIEIEKRQILTLTRILLICIKGLTEKNQQKSKVDLFLHNLDCLLNPDFNYLLSSCVIFKAKSLLENTAEAKISANALEKALFDINRDLKNSRSFLDRVSANIDNIGFTQSKQLAPEI